MVRNFEHQFAVDAEPPFHSVPRIVIPMDEELLTASQNPSSLFSFLWVVVVVVVVVGGGGGGGAAFPRPFINTSNPARRSIVRGERPKHSNHLFSRVNIPPFPLCST